MKHSNIFKLFCITIASVSASILVSSCNKDLTPEVNHPSRERISVNIGVSSSLSTKSTSITEENEKNIKNVQIFVFREDGALDAYAKTTEGSLSVSCTAGERIIYALVNSPSLTTVSSLSSFLNTSSYLFDNDTDGFQMIGGTKTELYSGASVEISVKRIVSRVIIEKISTDFTSEVYKTAEFSIDKIYMVNVGGSTKLSDFALTNPTSTVPGTWLNQKKNSSDLSEFLLDDSINYALANKKQYTGVHTFYTYPNPTQQDSQDESWCKRFTRLVVEATLDGHKYYYPVSIENIGSNKTYRITNLTITRPGSLSPDIPVTKAECSFSTSLSEWTETEANTEEI